MKAEKKLTSVHILDDVYKKFKVAAIDENINLQKLVNRSLDLYVKNPNFRDTTNEYTKLLFEYSNKDGKIKDSDDLMKRSIEFSKDKRLLDIFKKINEIINKDYGDCVTLSDWDFHTKDRTYELD